MCPVKPVLTLSNTWLQHERYLGYTVLSFVLIKKAEDNSAIRVETIAHLSETFTLRLRQFIDVLSSEIHNAEVKKFEVSICNSVVLFITGLSFLCATVT